MEPLSASEIFMRLGVAFVAGTLLGYERETRGRPAGLRTTILTCVAAATATLLAHQYAVTFTSTGLNGQLRSDPGRLVAGVLTGIGFLGAGTILRHNSAVRGVTTAATLWLSTMLGLVFGSGEWMIGFTALAIGGITLGLLPKMEGVIPRSTHARISITTTIDGPSEHVLRETITGCGRDVHVRSAMIDADFAGDRRVVHYQVSWQAANTFAFVHMLMDSLSSQHGVLRVQWD